MKYEVYTGTRNTKGLTIEEDIAFETDDLQVAVEKAKEESYYLGLEKEPEKQICEVRENIGSSGYNVVWNWLDECKAYNIGYSSDGTIFDGERYSELDMAIHKAQEYITRQNQKKIILNVKI